MSGYYIGIMSLNRVWVHLRSTPANPNLYAMSHNLPTASTLSINCAMNIYSIALELCTELEQIPIYAS